MLFSPIDKNRTVKRTTAFWDASALVPLCVHEAASRHAQSYLRRFAPVVWWESPVEVHSGLRKEIGPR